MRQMDPATFATAYGLASSAGIRPFLTLAVASVAMHFGYLHPAHAFAFLGTAGATYALAALALLEFVADKIPGVDHALHVLHFAIKPAVAALLVGGTLPGSGLAPDVAMALAAVNALGIHTGIATLRGASTSLTLGIGNPIVSLVEDLVSIAATLLAVLLPFAGAALAVALTLVVIFVARAVISRLRGRRAPNFATTR